MKNAPTTNIRNNARETSRYEKYNIPAVEMEAMNVERSNAANSSAARRNFRPS